MIDGELVVTPVSLIKHQIVSMNIISALDRLVRDGGLGRVLHPPTGVRLTPDNLSIPDIVFVAQDRLHVIGAKTIDAPPDLVVEILSLGTRQRDLTTKRNLYARFGVQEYWIVDPDARTITVLALTGDKYETVPLADDDMIQSRVLPGLSLTLTAVFMGTTEL
ncbi:MAG: Uma2 family endonuclease [Chloroflexi bacterium]|nr:Uma2 family endonuclease [Chloroflexota bacterium]